MAHIGDPRVEGNRGTPSGQSAQPLTYDANGNQLTGLGGKIMTYDGENRPLSVTLSSKKTCYV